MLNVVQSPAFVPDLKTLPLPFSQERHSEQVGEGKTATNKRRRRSSGFFFLEREVAAALKTAAGMKVAGKETRSKLWKVKIK